MLVVLREFIIAFGIACEEKRFTSRIQQSDGLHAICVRQRHEVFLRGHRVVEQQGSDDIGGENGRRHRAFSFQPVTFREPAENDKGDAGENESPKTGESGRQSYLAAQIAIVEERPDHPSAPPQPGAEDAMRRSRRTGERGCCSPQSASDAQSGSTRSCRP